MNRTPITNSPNNHKLNARLPLLTLILLAWRNLWRNNRRTAIMLTAIAIGVWAMIFMSALMRGMIDDMLRRGINQLPGHVQIHNPQYLDDPSVVNSMPEPSGALLETLEQSQVIQWFSRVRVPALIASEYDSRGVILLGIDASSEAPTILSHLTITQGRFLENSNDQGVVIGANLAQKLDTRLGKRIVVTSQDPNNNLVELGLRVVGIYQSELRSQEEVFIYIDKTRAQKFVNIEGQVSEVAIFGADHHDAIALQTSLSSTFENASVKSWRDINSFLASTVEVIDGFVLVFIIVIFLTLSFGLANTLVMAIFERVRETGLMLALGMKPPLLMWQILFESVFLLLVGLLIGNILSVISIQAIGDGIDLSGVAKGFDMAGMGSTLYPLLLFNDLLTANAVVILLGLATSLLPAWRAAHYDPVRALSKST